MQSEDSAEAELAEFFCYVCRFPTTAPEYRVCMYTYSADHVKPALAGTQCGKIICADCASTKKLIQDRKPEKMLAYCIDHNFTMNMTTRAKIGTRPYTETDEAQEDLMASDCVTIVSTAALRKKGMPLKIKIQGKMETLLPLDGKQFTNGEINCFMQGFRDPNTKFPMVKARLPGDRRWDLHPHPPAEYKPHVPKIRKLLILDEDEQDDTYKDAEKDLKTNRFLDKLYGTQKHVPPTGREMKLLDVEELMVMRKQANAAAKIFNSRMTDILADGKNCSDSEDMEGTDKSGSSSSADEESVDEDGIDIIDLEVKPQNAKPTAVVKKRVT
jgi:hypothetical protein